MVADARRRRRGGWPGWRSACARFWLEARLRFAIRVRQARYSPRTALRRGLRIGLPAAAVIAATVPVWGMSWYFDTENWAAGIWNSWAEARTDTWREAMVRSVMASQAVGDGRRRVRRDARRAARGGRLLVHRDRRHRRGRCLAARAARLAADGRRRSPTCGSSCCRRTSSTRPARCATTRRTSGCRSRACACRSTPSPATTTGTTRSRASPPRSSSPPRRGSPCARASRPTSASRSTTDARHRGAHRDGRPASAGSTACRSGVSARRSSRSRTTSSR